jgi:predicted nucleic acid-binding protein
MKTTVELPDLLYRQAKVEAAPRGRKLKDLVEEGRRLVLDAPLLVCEPVLTEAIYLLGRFPRARDALFGLLQNGAFAVAFQLAEHVATLRRLMRKYLDTPMSLADACVVRMAEIHEDHNVLTLDSDFTVYRKRSRSLIRIMHPAVPIE